MNNFRNVRILALVVISITLILFFGFKIKTQVCASLIANTCYTHLIQIDGAKGYAEQKYGLSRYQPVPVDKLLPCFRSGVMPTCPTDGKYRIGVLGDQPRCSIHGMFNQHTFHFAAFKGDVKLVNKMLLDYAVDYRYEYEDGWTALHWASYGGQTGTVALLLRRGANVNAKTQLGETPLALSANTNVDSLLKNYGAKEEAQSARYRGSKGVQGNSVMENKEKIKVKNGQTGSVWSEKSSDGK